MPRGLKGFEWDAGNKDKNEAKHGVTNIECEEVFFNRPLLLSEDERHSGREKRYAALGVTHGKRLLSAVFTIRGGKIRVISARPMSRRERETYEKSKAKTNPKIQE